MKQMLVILVAVMLVGCGKKDSPEPQAKNPIAPKVDVNATTMPMTQPKEEAKNPQPPKATPQKLITDPIVEKAIRLELKKSSGELTESDLEKITRLGLPHNVYTNGVVVLDQRHHLECRLIVNQITDASLKEVAKLQQMEQLNLSDSKITDAGLGDIAKLQKLTNLDLGRTQITDVGLKEVAKLQKLEFLELNGTQITDAGLKDVAKMKQLTYLILRNTQVTKAGVVDFYDKSLSNCIVSNDYKVRPRKIENIPTRRRNPRESP